MNTIVKRILKVLAWIVGIVIFLVILILILIQVPAVQNFAKNKAVAWLQGKIKTKVSIDKLSISFPKEIVLEGVYFEDQKKDTLLYTKELRVDIALFQLLHHEVDVNYFELNGLKTHIYRIQPDTTYNFNYIANAFSSPPTTPQPVDTSSSGMKFNINHVVFKDILATFKDDNTGNDVYFYLGNFDMRLKKVDPDKQIYNVASVDIANVDTRVHQYTPLSPPKAVSVPQVATASATSAPPTIGLDQLGLQNIKLNYSNDVSGMLANINIGDFITHVKSINTQNLALAFNDIKLNNTLAAVTINKVPSPQKQIPAQASADTTQASPWNVDLTNLSLHNNDISYNDNTQPHAKSGMDYSHLHIQNLQFDADNVQLNQATYKGKIKQLAFNEQSGFSMQQLHTNFYYSDTAAFLQNLLLIAGRTELKDKLVVKYPSIKTMSSEIGDIYIDADLKNSSVDMKDVLEFAPQLASNLKGNEKTVLHVNTSVKGYVKDLSIPEFQLSGIGNTYVDVSGKMQGLPDAQKANFDVTIKQFRTTAADIKSLVPKNAIPSNIRIPQALSATGYFKGGMKDFVTQLQLNSTNGKAYVKGGMHGTSYAADVVLTDLNVGYLTKQENNIGTVTLTAKAKGKGFDVKTAIADVAAQVKSAQVKGYTYKNFNLAANANNGVANVNANINDSNIAFNLAASANVATTNPTNVKLQLQLDTINLNALHLMADTLGLHGTVNADIPVANIDSLVGKISLSNLSVTTPQQTFYPDSMYITADANGTQRNLNIQSEFLKANLSGAYRFSEMGQALQQTINQYYHTDSFMQKSIVAEDWQLDATFFPTPFILQLVSGAKGTDSIKVKANFNSTANNLNASIKTKKLVYSGTQADSVNVQVNTANNKLNFDAGVKDVNAGSVSLFHTEASGFVADNKVNMDVVVDDQKNKARYTIGGVLQQIAQGLQFSLKPDSLTLDYMKWGVARDNYIQYDSAGLIINNFKISNQGQSLSINSTEKTPNAPLQVQFKDFQIGTITKMANQDSLQVAGSINGTATVKNATTNPVFTTDLTVNNLEYMKDTIGTVAIKVNNEQVNAFAADIAVVSNNNDLRVNGIYNTKDSAFDLSVVLNKFNLATIKPFVKDELADAAGTIKANIKMKGTIDKPSITGGINFVDASLTPAISGEMFKLSNDTITIDAQGVHFNRFALLDSANNRAELTGDVLTTDFKKFVFAASLDARNFVIVNTPKSANKTFYGKLDISAHVKVSGPLDAPAATGSISINPTTDFVYVRVDNDPEVQERDGVVQFVDAKHPDSSGIKALYDSTATSSLRGMDVNIDIETDSLAKLTMVVDPSTGDALTVQGIANLNGGIDRSGKTTLTGSYQITQGNYQVSISALKRKFILQNGSTIVWTGDPTLAQVNLKAIYFANAPSIDLIQQQIVGPDLTRFKQVLPFQVELSLQGDLLKPGINFDITLPPDLLAQWPDVDLKLQQVRTDPSELNKQVFALLLLGRFLQDDPFASGGGATTVEDLAVQSVSGILANQLDQLAASIVKGVTVNFSIISAQDYSTGAQQTYSNVNIGVSKKLLKDNRLVLSVGTDIGLQGPANTPTQVENTNVTGNFSVDYKLTKDGRYRVQIYRKNDYEEIIVGQVVETGASFILTMDYNKFSDLFKKRKDAASAQASTDGIDHTKIIDKDKKNSSGAPPANTPQQQ